MSSRNTEATIMFQKVHVFAILVCPTLHKIT